MKTIGAFLTVLATLSAADSRQWIRDHATSLKSVQAGQGFADMQPLKKLVGDARIVSLGEATHGTREFFQLKHRMLEFLAHRDGLHHLLHRSQPARGPTG